MMNFQNDYFRNAQGDLHDIKFEFNKATETVPDVVSEMVSASLIDERDAQAGKHLFGFFLVSIFIILVTSTMTKLVENPSLTTATFALVRFSFFRLIISYSSLN